MTLVPYDPFKQLGNMKRDFDRFFSDFSFPFEREPNFGGVRVDVYETENEVVTICDIPGLEKKEDVHIAIENNQLLISGFIHKTQEIKEENLFCKERYAGSFHRSIHLPVHVSTEGVKATYKNGVLEIRMSKQMQDHQKTIDVEFH